MAREAKGVCLRVLKGSTKSRFDSFSARNSVLIISHNTFRDCRVNIFSDLSRNSCSIINPPCASLYLHIRPELDRNSASVDLIHE